jgi:hypothetical protein
MSAYRPGHDPYIDYGAAAHPEEHSEERVFVPHVQDIQHGGPHGQGLHEQHLGAHQHQQHHQQHPVYAEQHSMSHHQSPQFGPGQGMMYGGPSQMGQSSGSMGQSSGGMGPPSGTKRQRPDDMEELGMEMQGQQMRAGEMSSMSQQMPPQSMVGVPSGYGQVQHFHTHPLPISGHRSKMPRMSESDSMAGPSGSAPSVLGMEGMPLPAARPRGPKLKFTPEDDGLLVDLKENKSLTWKQIAEFFPGRSSGTLQVRYCTKLKAKTTQWTDETVSLNAPCILIVSKTVLILYYSDPKTSDGPP